jgi:nucleoside-diphosphate-sugar epimerase
MKFNSIAILLFRNYKDIISLTNKICPMKVQLNHKNVWISGSRGFIGTHLVSELTKFYNITCVSNRKNTENHDDQLIFVDFQNEISIRDTIEKYGVPDIFIHLGWGDVPNPHSEMHLKENVSQSKKLITELFKAGLDKFIFMGSMNEYGDRTGSLSEEMKPVGWLTNYTKGKIEVASFGFTKALEMNKKFIHIRLFYTYGPLGGSLIQDLYRAYKNKTTVSLGSCEHYRDYAHISDIIKGIKLLCDVNESTTVNLGSGKAIRLKEFVSVFWNLLGGKSEMLHFGEKIVGKEQPQPYCYANLDKLQKLTGGWTPSTSLEDGIRLTIEGLDQIYAKTPNRI